MNAATSTPEICKSVESDIMEVESKACNSNQQSAESGNMMQTPKKRKFAEPRFISEIKTPDVSTPKRARRVLSLVRRIDEKKSKMIQTLQNKNRYLMKRIASLKELIKHLNNKGLMTEEAGNNLMDMLPSSMKDIVSRNLKKKGQYSPEIRSFALTLHFYSPKAYNYVRKHWNKLLPHPSTLRQWYRVVDGSPGFTKEAFDAIALRATSKPVIINLVVDEMSIKEANVFFDNEFHGGVDCGTVNVQQENDNVPMATNAYAIQHETENHATLLTGTGDFVKIPKIGAIHKKTLPRSSPSHGTFSKEEEWHRNANLSPCPKSLTSLGEGKQTLTAVDRRNIENRQKNQNKGTKRPTPSIVDENRRSRPSPGVSGDEESSVKEGEKKCPGTRRSTPESLRATTPSAGAAVVRRIEAAKPQKFLRAVEEYEHSFGLNSPRLLGIAVDCLKGNAKHWTGIYRDNWRTYEDFKRDFLKTYWSAQRQRDIRFQISTGRYDETKGTMLSHFA
ncbi:hypothetical protein MTP99_002886 [Tenebrio molitor]|nr:hypothetical protein MTP99_002886 [Tenebrio molitor]